MTRRRRAVWILGGGSLALIIAMAVVVLIETRRGDDDPTGSTATDTTSASTTSSSPSSSPSSTSAPALIAQATDDDYTCIVHDDRDQPVSGAIVRVSDELSTSRTYVTDATGEARVQATSAMLFEASHPVAGRGRARVGSIDEVRRRVVIQLARAETAPPIKGRVVDVHGTPVPHAVVRAMHVMTAQHPRGETRADGTGAFRLGELDAGEHVVWVVCDGCTSSRVRATTGDDLTLVVGGGGSVVGRVIDSDDRPVTAFTVRLLRPRMMREVPLEEHTVDDPDGRFDFTGVAPDAYVVRVVAAGHAPSEAVPVTLTADRTEIVVRLATGGTVAGVVTDRDSGVPIANAVVSIDRMRSDSTTMTTSDASGSFVLAGVAPGMMSIRALAPDHHAALANGIRVEDGKTSTANVQLSAVKAGEHAGMDLVGIGARLSGDGDALAIDSVLPGGGAEAAGLVAGDAIVSIEGHSVADLGLRDAMEHVRGSNGTRVVLTVRRKGDGPTETIIVERRAFRYNPS